MSSPSSSSSSPLISRTWRYDVFPSFSGEDVRKTFLSHLIKKLQRKLIITFIDNDIERSRSIGPELVVAIRESRLLIVVFSKNYASSTWCLSELVEIHKCFKKKLGQMVVPVFYDVDPSRVRKQTGEFGKAFDETCEGKTEDLIQRWKSALEDVANIAGYDFHRWSDEAKMIEEISEDVSDKLFPRSDDFGDFVGIEAHIEAMSSILCLESEQVRMVGIVGPSGIGKSTIARALFNRISRKFHHWAFVVPYKRIKHQDDYGMQLSWEKQFLGELLCQNAIKIDSLGVVKQRLKHKKVFIVLDDVDDLEVLDTLVEQTGCFGSGSRIIVVTQDRALLEAHNIDLIYEVEFPSRELALQMFCRSAFKQNSPPDGFWMLASEVTDLSGKLPLGLKVLGSSLRGKANLVSLTHLNLSGCSRLTSFPQISTSIAFLSLDNTGIEEVPSLIENIAGLTRLSMIGCKKLRKISATIWNLKHLEFADFTDCGSLTSISDDSMVQTVAEIPDLSKAINLKYPTNLIMKGCTSVEVLPTNINSLSLTSLDLSGWSRLTSFPQLSTSISVLCLNDTGIEEVPSWIENIAGLTRLSMRGCKKLRKISAIIWNLKDLECADFTGCGSLTSISNASLVKTVAELHAESIEKYTNDDTQFLFHNCFNLDRDAHEFILQSDCGVTVLHIKQVPKYFTHRTCGSSLSVPLPQISLCQYNLRIKACFILDNGATDFFWVTVHWKFRGVTGICRTHEICRDVSEMDHLVVFNFDFCPRDKIHDPPSQLDSNNVEFEFEIHSHNDWRCYRSFSIIDRNLLTCILHNEIKGCGVRVVSVSPSMINEQQDTETLIKDASSSPQLINFFRQLYQEKSSKSVNTESERSNKRMRVSFGNDLQWQNLASLLNEAEHTTKLTCLISVTSWIIDTCASNHMIGSIHTLVEISDMNPMRIKLPDGRYTMATKQGIVKLGPQLSLQNVFFVDGLQCHLISISQLNRDRACVFQIIDKLCIIQDRITRMLIGAGEEHNGLYSFRSMDEGAAMHNSEKRLFEIWHQRLGHLASKAMELLSISDLSSNKNFDFKACEVCIRAK